MMSYRDEKRVFSGDTCLEVVNEMRKAANCEKSVFGFMREVRDRMEILKGITIRTNAVGFLDDLESAGVLHFIRNLQ